MRSLKGLFCCVILVGSSQLSSYCQSNVKGNVDYPNIIIILSDDQGWGDFSVTGNVNLSTRNIDQLAEEGAFFEKFYVTPVCSPTRAELLTGRYHTRMGVHGTSRGGEVFAADEATLAEVFKNAGYTTGVFGKWHNGMQPPYHPNGRGFDEFYGFCSGHWGNYFSPLLEHNGELVHGNGYLTDDLTDKALEFIDDNKDNPFLLYLAYNTPHSPMQVPDRWWDRFENKDLELFSIPSHNEDTLFSKAALAMCENIDWNVGRLLQKLSADKMDHNTIVIYFTDNGPNSWRWNDNLKGIKGSVDEGGVRSPLFIRYPGIIEPGMRITSISGAIDILPTLTDLAEIDNNLSKILDGKSLVPLLNGENWQDDRYIFSHWNGKTSVRNQRFIYTNKGELYDLMADPSQLSDISMANKKIKDRMAKVLEDWEKEVQIKELKKREIRFPIGHPDYPFTQLPARDGVAHGNILRSAKSPNNTFFTNWIDLEDQITWDVEILETGDYEVEMYYTCSEQDIGAEVELSFRDNVLSTTVDVVHDPPLKGMENDRIKRTQSYVKDFRKLTMGTIHLDKAKGILKLKATKVPGNAVIDFRLLNFKKI